MSSADFEDDVSKDDAGKNGGDSNGNGQDNDSLANKLSEELSNWRRKRTSARPRPGGDGPSQSFQSSGPARTIKVRGHETLVVRKTKLSGKPPTNTNHTPNNQ